MLTTNNFEIEQIQYLTGSYIEEALNKMGIKPLRWAITDVKNGKYILSVSYESN